MMPDGEADATPHVETEAEPASDPSSESATGVLLVAATPIGNLGDITPRVVDAFRAADLVLAEDTRRTRTLLTHLDIRQKELARLDAHAEANSVDRVLSRLEAGHRVVLVSDAGTPAISDPGARLVRAAKDAGHEVTALPGATAVTTAIAVSGFVSTRFRFMGFVPRKGKALADVLATIAATEETVVFFESASRIQATLEALSATMAERPVVVARELTKKHEELVEGTVAELCERERERRWRGEITVVLGPHAADVPRIGEEELAGLIDEALATGERKKAIAKRLAAQTGYKTRDLYQRIVDRPTDRTDE